MGSPAPQALYDMLAQVHTVAAGCARFSAQQDHVVRAADVAQPLLTVVLQGGKQFGIGSEASLHVAEGEDIGVDSGLQRERAQPHQCAQPALCQRA